MEMGLFEPLQYEFMQKAMIGGLAVAVASDEEKPGQLDAWKRETLLAAGADVVIADFRDLPGLLKSVITK